MSMLEAQKNKLKKVMARFASDEAGATAIEYGIITVVLSIVLLGFYASTADTMSETLTDVADGLTGS